MGPGEGSALPQTWLGIQLCTASAAASAPPELGWARWVTGLWSVRSAQAELAGKLPGEQNVSGMGARFCALVTRGHLYWCRQQRVTRHTRYSR